MATNQQNNDQEIPTTVHQSESENVEEIDAAHADGSDSWETDDEGDFYNDDDDDGRWVENHADDDDESVDIGLPKPLIQCYPTTTAEEVSVVGKLCDICLNDYKSNDQLRTIPCLHRFHTKCIDKWLKKSSKCPMCRSDLRKSEWYSSSD